tara:strand:- start:12 stop:185 length:174 start_codon:yes stop_codon:yes gene_type:complete
MNKLNIIASIVEGETLCSFTGLLEDQTFKKMFYKLAETHDVDEASKKLVEYANENLA